MKARFALNLPAAETMARRRRSTLVFTLAMTLLLAPAFAQSSGVSAMTNRCILQLRAPSLNFDQSLQGTKWNAVAHSPSGKLWMVENSSSCDSARNLPKVEQVQPAVSLIVTLQDRAAVPEKEIEDIGGVVVEKLQNLNVMTLAVPVAAVGRVAQLPGVARVQKDQPQSANDTRKK